MLDNSFFQAICRVGIFMICAQAMVHFRPQEAYEKYLKLLVSVMVLIQLFLPIGKFLLRGGGQEAARLLEQFQRDLEQDMRDAAESAEAADALLEQMTLEEVMRRLEAQQEEASGSQPGGSGQEWMQGREVSGGQGSQGEAQGREVSGGQGSLGGAQGREASGGQKNGDGTQNQDVSEVQENRIGGQAAGTGGISVEVEAVEPIVIEAGRE